MRMLIADVVTCDPQRARAQAILVAGDLIRAVGDVIDLERQAPEAEREVLNGTLIPGFIDPHHHFLLGALDDGSARLRLPAGTSMTRLLAAVGEQITAQRSSDPDGAWVRLHGYDPSGLAERRPPSRAELDRLCPDRPLILISYFSGTRRCSTPQDSPAWAGPTTCAIPERVASSATATAA